MPHAAEGFLKLPRGGLHTLGIGNVAHHIFHLQFHWPFTAAQAAIEHAHARAFRRKRRGNRAPNPAAAAEHHHALVCELEIHARSVNQPVAGRNVR